MNFKRWREIRPLIEEVLELPIAERPAYLARIKDEELRAEVIGLLTVSPEEMAPLEKIHFVPDPKGFPIGPGDTVEHYEVVREIDRGGMGAVFEGKDLRNGRPVALKILSPNAIRFAPNEDKALARLSHSNIATFYESGTTSEGFRFVAMEYVSGISLTSFCAKHCPTVESRLQVFRKICGAVEYAHRHLVVHRDLKPENILVTDDGEPKLLDFGIAKLLPSSPDLPTLTVLDGRAFTVAFASPEQLSGEHTTTATDIYSLGALLCVLLTGELPYKVHRDELPWAIRNMEPLRPSSLVGPLDETLPEGGKERLRRRLSGDLDAIILRALRKEPDRRYASVSELSEDIRRYLDLEPVSARRGTRSYRAMKFVRRHRYGTLAGALAVLGTVVFLAVLLFLRSEAVQERDKAIRERERAESVSTFLVDMFRVSNPWTETGETISAREVLDGAFRKLASAPPPDPVLRGTLRHSLGKVHLNLGFYTPAETLLAPALRDLRRSPTENRSLTAEALVDLAWARYERGEFDLASRDALRSLSISQEFPDRSSFEVKLLLGDIAFARGNFNGAKREFQAALFEAVRSSGPLSLQAASALHGLAACFHADKRYADAARYYGESLSIRKRLLGERHPAVLQVLHNLACLYRDQGNTRRSLALFREVHASYRGIWHYPGTPTLFHNLALSLLSEGEFEEAAELLYDSFTRRRTQFGERHPDIGRTLAEFGRLEDSRERFNEAERRYIAGLERLREGLGQNHPDTIAAEQNYAVLLLHQGRRREGEAIFRKLLNRSGGRSFYSQINATLQKNLSILTGGKREPYMTLPIKILDLRSSGDVSPFAPHGLPRAAAPPSLWGVLFSDEFSGETINPQKWEYGGNTVEVEDGKLYILRTVTDRGGKASTIPISLDPTRPVVISRKAKVYAANEFFDGSMAVEITGYPEKRFGVSYANCRYDRDGEVSTVGFSIFRQNANSHRFADRKVDVSPLIPPIWGKWFEEELLYDPRTGEVRYRIDGRERLSYNVGPLPPSAPSITLTFSTWGWYTGHYQHMDWIRVAQ